MYGAIVPSSGTVALIQSCNGGAWTQLTSLPGLVTKKPVSMAAWCDLLVLAAVDANGLVYIAWSRPAIGYFSGWRPTTMKSTNAPAIVGDPRSTALVLLMTGGATGQVLCYSMVQIDGVANRVSTTACYAVSGAPATSDRPAAFVVAASPTCYTIALAVRGAGANANRIYYNDGLTPGWVDSGTVTASAPAIAVVNGNVWLGYQAADGSNMHGLPARNIWKSLPEGTVVGPCLSLSGGKLVDSYVLNGQAKVQLIQP